MQYQNGTPSKENTEEKEYTFYCEERLVRVLFFILPRGYRFGPPLYRRETRRYLSDSQNGDVVNKLSNVSLLSLSSYYQRGATFHGPLYKLGHILFIVLYSFIFHTKNSIYCMLTFIIQGSVLIYNIFFIFRQRITWSSIYMKHLIAIKHFK